ncbi:MAG: DUF2155 domain-containing protein [Aestuariivirgaceae bacterium]
MARFAKCCAAVATGLVAALSALPADAGPIRNPIAIFAGLDKITGVITTFEIEIDKTKRFGALNVSPRICNTRPAIEEPKTTAFVEIDENLLDGKLNRIFTGWMLAQSPGLNAVEHPVYDVWLTGCRDAKSQPEPELTPPANTEIPKQDN